jgi:hypothetical protein
MGKRVAILQSNYIPWKGYFHMIKLVDEFVLYDDVQYTRRDWRNRNKIKTPDGLKWLTVPVRDRYASLKICEVEVAVHDWAEKHWNAIETHYKKAPYFEDIAPHLRKMYEEAAAKKYLSEINYIFLSGIGKLLNISTCLTWSMDCRAQGQKTDRLIDILRKTEARIYLSGPAGRNYIEEDKFRDAGIALEWMKYEYPEYPQLYPPFEHGVSVVDLLFCLPEGVGIW